MLDFAWHLRGSVNLKDADANDVVLDRLEQLLTKQGKGDRQRGIDRLAFNDPLWGNFFGPNWLAMVIYDRGQFWIEYGINGRSLRYDLRSLHGMVFCLFAALVAFFFGLAGGGLWGGLTLAAGAFVWLYGMNILLAVFRVPSAIHRAVAARR